MKESQSNWQPLCETPSNELFINSYSGILSQRMEVNRPILDKYLGIVSLDGPVTLTGMSSDRFRAVSADMTSEGSLMGKMGLRFGDKLPTVKKDSKNKISTLDSVKSGWKISINDDLLFKKHYDKRSSDARAVEEDFTKSFDSRFTGRLELAAVLDKCSFAKDPFVSGRIFVSLAAFRSVAKLLTNPGLDSAQGTMLFLFALGITNLQFHHYGRPSIENHPDHWASIFWKFINFRRRTVKSLIEYIDIPWEVDRLGAGLAYLNFQKLTGNKLIRLQK